MDMAEYYRTTREKELPEAFKNHFESGRKSIEKNLNILQTIIPPSSATVEGQALVTITRTVSEKIFSFLDSMNNDIEALFVYQSLNRKKFSEIYSVLEKHGITLDNISNDEGLKWINDYFKRAEKTSLD